MCHVRKIVLSIIFSGCKISLDMKAIAKKNIIKILAGAAGILLGIATCVCTSAFNVGLSSQGCVCLGVLVFAIVWWVAGVLPEYATAVLMVVAFFVFGNVDVKTSTAAFSTSTMWLLFAAFALGAGMKTCGLMKRIAHGIISKFPNTYLSQITGVIAAGTVLGPLVPSLSAKTAMLTPIAMNMGDACGYERKGKQQQGLFLAMLTGVRNVGPAIIAASPIGYALWGLMPADVQTRFDMLHWFLAALPWFVAVSILNLVAIYLLYKPCGSLNKSKNAEQTKHADHAKHGVKDSSADNKISTEKNKHDSPDNTSTPMSTKEKCMLVIILLTVILWVSEPLHHISSHIVALAAFVAMIACGILDAKSLKSDVAWTSLIFIGIAVSLSSVFEQVGIQDWIVSVASPLFEQLSANPYIFVLGIGVVTIILRFIIVSELAYINIVMAFLIPIAMNVGVNPFVVGFAVYAVVNPWFALYQNPVYLAAFYSVDGAMVRHADMAKYCTLYMLICLAGLAISVPYWQMMGLFGG